MRKLTTAQLTAVVRTLERSYDTETDAHLSSALIKLKEGLMHARLSAARKALNRARRTTDGNRTQG